MPDSTPLDTVIVAVPETAGSALYGMVDVLSVTGNVWQTLTRTDPRPSPFRVHVVSVGRARFRCGNGLRIDCSAAETLTRRRHPPHVDLFAAGVAAAAAHPHPVPPPDFTSASSAQHALVPDGAGPPQQACGAPPCARDLSPAPPFVFRD